MFLFQLVLSVDFKSFGFQISPLRLFPAIHSSPSLRLFQMVAYLLAWINFAAHHLLSQYSAPHHFLSQLARFRILSLSWMVSIKDPSFFLRSRLKQSWATLFELFSLQTLQYFILEIYSFPQYSRLSPLLPHLESPLDFDCFILCGDQDQTSPPSVPSSSCCWIFELPSKSPQQVK